MRIHPVLWLLSVAYALAAAWSVDRYWKHDLPMKLVVLAPLALGALGLLVATAFDRQIGRLRRDLARRRRRAAPPPPEDRVTIHLRGLPDVDACAGTDDIYAFQERLRAALEGQALGVLVGNELGADEVLIFLAGPDAEAIFRRIEPILRSCPLARGALVRLKSRAPAANEREVRIG